MITWCPSGTVSSIVRERSIPRQLALRSWALDQEGRLDSLLLLLHLLSDMIIHSSRSRFIEQLLEHIEVILSSKYLSNVFSLQLIVGFWKRDFRPRMCFGAHLVSMEWPSHLWLFLGHCNFYISIMLLLLLLLQISTIETVTIILISLLILYRLILLTLCASTCLNLFNFNVIGPWWNEFTRRLLRRYLLISVYSLAVSLLRLLTCILWFL